MYLSLTALFVPMLLSAVLYSILFSMGYALYALMTAIRDLCLLDILGLCLCGLNSVLVLLNQTQANIRNKKALKY